VKRIFLWLIGGILLAEVGYASVLYRWRDPQGTVHVSDTPPAAGIYKTIQNEDCPDSKIPSKNKFHFITTQIEHPCVLKSFNALEQAFSNKISITYLPVNNNGLIDLKRLEKSIQDNTVLVSIMFVNNEIGTVQPIKKIGSLRDSRTIWSFMMAKNAQF